MTIFWPIRPAHHRRTEYVARLPPQGHVQTTWTFHPWQQPPPLQFLINSVTVSFRVQYEIYYKLSGQLIQGITSPLYCLNHPDQISAPNADGWHTSPDLPPQSIITKTETSIVCTILSSSTFVLKYSWEELCTDHTHHAKNKPNFEFITRFRRPRWSSCWFPEPGHSSRTSRCGLSSMFDTQPSFPPLAGRHDAVDEYRRYKQSQIHIFLPFVCWHT
jgi:hypothetical protein